MADKISGTQKTAILLLAMGDKYAVDVFKHLDRREIIRVSKAMVEMDSVPKEMVEEVLEEFNQLLALGENMLVGSPDRVRKMLQGLDSETAKYVLDSLDLDAGPGPFKALESISPKLLAQILRNEHPQTLALILGHLDSEQAAGLLQNMPAGARAEVLIRLARLEAVPADMLEDVGKVLDRQLIAMGGREGRKVGGVPSVAEILNAVERATEEEVLADIEEESTQLAEEIRQLMFVFEDIKTLDDRGIRELLKEVSNDELTLALKGASEELQAKFYSNLSERAATMIKEDLEIMGPVKLSEVETAQMNVVKVVRRLEVEGRIIITSKGGGDVLL
ncbi:flagellar motor switch protein FliG [Desulfonatronum sp. SC1]|uniref:flagellar motor switch protein FliG n=1 Tax=Desulfonatronum sp. SC1 TaxID=2109626 RepID=UPI000D30C630|nr:flagellar motor switch protein FliG [Desulfonatronum sp. SC1]PTN33580.1 flagellar motor switch protein FliG [Desulfonatronum sp. SC1]